MLSLRLGRNSLRHFSPPPSPFSRLDSETNLQKDLQKTLI